MKCERMSRCCVQFALLAIGGLPAVVSQSRWRETLLEQAHERIETWYTNPSLMESPHINQGIKVSMLKRDVVCGGDAVPVTFAEFDVSGARPVDVFNTMLDTPKQPTWNPQAASVDALGDYPDRGTRAWDVVFKFPLLNPHEFVQWQAADAQLDKQEFWLVFSTQQNADLLQKHTVHQGATDSQNCLGAYHITAGQNGGAHVIITQNVNIHPFFPFPLHQILHFFPPAWQGTINFVHQLQDHARQLAKSGSPPSQTVAPAYMLQGAPAKLFEAAAAPKVQKAGSPKFLGLGLMLCIPASCLLIAGLGFYTRRSAVMNSQAYMAQDEENAENDFE